MSHISRLARLIVGIVLLACTPSADAADTTSGPGPCAARSEVVAKLARRYGETLRSVGLERADGVVEIYASERTGTWTILVTRPTACPASSPPASAGRRSRNGPPARMPDQVSASQTSFAPVTARSV